MFTRRNQILMTTIALTYTTPYILNVVLNEDFEATKQLVSQEYPYHLKLITTRCCYMIPWHNPPPPVIAGGKIAMSPAITK